MIQLNLTVKQALAVYALLGETTSGCIYLNQVEEYLKDSLSEDIRQHVWDGVRNGNGPVDVDEWDGVIDDAVLTHVS